MNKTMIIVIVVGLLAIVAIYFFFSKKKDKREQELMDIVKQKAINATVIFDKETGQVLITEESITIENAQEEGYEETSQQEESVLKVVKDNKEEIPFQQDEPSAEELIEQEIKNQAQETKKQTIKQPVKEKIPDYVTKKMKEKLTKLGYSLYEANSMKPKLAYFTLKNKVKKIKTELPKETGNTEPLNPTKKLSEILNKDKKETQEV